MDAAPKGECCELAPEAQTCPERNARVRGACPACAGRTIPVSAAHVMRHVSGPAGRGIAGEHGFCPAPGCRVIFVAGDGAVFTTADVRHPPAYKSGDQRDLLCFCFDVCGDDALSDAGDRLIAFIGDRVRAKDCACDTLNPSGGCCLGSIARYRKRHTV